VALTLTTNEIIQVVLQLPLEDRAQIFHALHESLIDEAIDHGPIEPADEVDADWGEDIARRVADIESDGVKTRSTNNGEP
jgi:hypothetical protein